MVAHTDGSEGLIAGSVSTGFIHATPGEIKSFRSSEDRIALIMRKEEFVKFGLTGIRL